MTPQSKEAQPSDLLPQVPLYISHFSSSLIRGCRHRTSCWRPSPHDIYLVTSRVAPSCVATVKSITSYQDPYQLLQIGISTFSFLCIFAKYVHVRILFSRFGLNFRGLRYRLLIQAMLIISRK